MFIFICLYIFIVFPKECSTQGAGYADKQCSKIANGRVPNLELYTHIHHCAKKSTNHKVFRHAKHPWRCPISQLTTPLNTGVYWTPVFRVVVSYGYRTSQGVFSMAKQLVDSGIFVQCMYVLKLLRHSTVSALIGGFISEVVDDQVETSAYNYMYKVLCRALFHWLFQNIINLHYLSISISPYLSISILPLDLSVCIYLSSSSSVW